MFPLFESGRGTFQELFSAVVQNVYVQVRRDWQRDVVLFGYSRSVVASCASNKSSVCEKQLVKCVLSNRVSSWLITERKRLGKGRQLSTCIV